MKTNKIKEYEYRLKELKGINPKLSIYKTLEENIKKLEDELGITERKHFKKPNWDKNVSVKNRYQVVYGGPNIRTSGAKFKDKANIYSKLKRNDQSI